MLIATKYHNDHSLNPRSLHLYTVRRRREGVPWCSEGKLGGGECEQKTGAQRHEASTRCHASIGRLAVTRRFFVDQIGDWVVEDRAVEARETDRDDALVVVSHRRRGKAPCHVPPHHVHLHLSTINRSVYLSVIPFIYLFVLFIYFFSAQGTQFIYLFSSSTSSGIEVQAKNILAEWPTQG